MQARQCFCGIFMKQTFDHNAALAFYTRRRRQRRFGRVIPGGDDALRSAGSSVALPGPNGQGSGDYQLGPQLEDGGGRVNWSLRG